MRIIRKKDINKIKITHNKKLFWIIILLIIALIILIYFIIQKNPKQITDIEKKNCVPATCCHPTECVLAEQAPDCSKMFCSAVCSGPLDCNAGHCEFINNKCEVVSDE